MKLPKRVSDHQPFTNILPVYSHREPTNITNDIKQINQKLLTFCKVVIAVSLLALLTTCGGGGGGGDSESNNNVGEGSITIEEPTTNKTYTTNSSGVWLSGYSFISSDWWSCCPRDSGVTVTWQNAATDGSGTAGSSVELAWCVLYLCYVNTWNAQISLAEGVNNLIRVTASDLSGNVGRDSITVSRSIMAPTVYSTTPADGAAFAAIDSEVIVRFSEPMNTGTINATTFTVSGGVTPASITFSGGDTIATFTPSASLVLDTTYTVTITTGAEDLIGNALTTDYTWSFMVATGYYSVGVTVSGLPPHQAIVLQNNGGDDLIVTADGDYTFSTEVMDGAGYAVTVSSQPLFFVFCTVANGSGTISGASVSGIAVTCTL